jgi:hypothetical protein
MNEWFVEVLDRQDNWVKWDSEVFDSFTEASSHAQDNGLSDKTHYYRINVQWNDRYAYHGPCH